MKPRKQEEKGWMPEGSWVLRNIELLQYLVQTNKTQENTSEMDGAGPDPQEITDKNLAHVNW